MVIYGLTRINGDMGNKTQLMRHCDDTHFLDKDLDDRLVGLSIFGLRGKKCSCIGS